MVDANKTKEIRNLVFVLSASVIAGFLFFLGLLYFYGPSGQYLINNVVLSPESLHQLSYTEGVKKSTKQQLRFAFDRIELMRWDLSSKTWKQEKISKELYQELYAILLSGSKNVEASPQINDLFYKKLPLSISIYVKPESFSDVMESKIFQTMQFAEIGDYFRVELIGANAGQEWAYFYRSGIYKEVSELLLRSTSVSLN